MEFNTTNSNEDQVPKTNKQLTKKLLMSCTLGNYLFSDIQKPKALISYV